MLIIARRHIDHGRPRSCALTGVTPTSCPKSARAESPSTRPRLLGSAAWPVAFVDVPGHHRFIRNMLAGWRRSTSAMLVVAVDGGPMPQTIETVQILNYLG
jgi:selenocysteine-specific elongation factor